jgi:hypothetical protein
LYIKLLNLLVTPTKQRMNAQKNEKDKMRHTYFRYYCLLLTWFTSNLIFFTGVRMLTCLEHTLVWSSYAHIFRTHSCLQTTKTTTTPSYQRTCSHRSPYAHIFRTHPRIIVAITRGLPKKISQRTTSDFSRFVQNRCSLHKL